MLFGKVSRPGKVDFTLPKDAKETKATGVIVLTIKTVKSFPIFASFFEGLF